MTRIRSRLIAGAAGIAIGTASSHSLASSGIIQWPPWFFCPTPSVSVCQAESGLTDTCATQNHSACVTLLQQEFQGEYAAAPTRGDMILPYDSAMNGAGLLTNGPIQPYDQRRVGFQWNADATLASILAGGRFPASMNASTAKLGLSANLAPLHPHWEANGGAITAGPSGGCAEYAYEKYYDYDRFEDAAASCLDDYACIYQVGVATTRPGLDLPQLSRRDGTAMTAQITSLPPVSQPKNGFFVKNPNVFLALLDQGQGGIPADLSTALGTTFVSMNRSFSYAAPDRMAWHQQMHAAQASEGLVADDFREMERRQQAYLGYSADLDALLAMLPPQTWASILLGVWTANCNGTITHGVPQTGGDQNGQNCTYSLTPAVFPTGSLASWAQFLAFELADLLVQEWYHVNPVTQQVDHGCLDPYSNRCDWSPKMFARDYVGLWQKDRESDYDKCIADTGDNLAIAPGNAYAPSQSDLQDTASLEAYLVRLDAAFAQATRDVPWLHTNGAAVPDTVGSEVSGGHGIGDPAWFAAAYAYDSLWALHFAKNGGGQICKADGEVRGQLTADITLLGLNDRVADFLFDMTAGRGGTDGGVIDTHFKIFSKDLYVPVVNQHVGGSAGGWNLTQATQIKGPQGQMMFPVLGIPVTIKAGANMQLGFTGSATVSAPQTCIPAQNDGSYPVLTAGGTLAPWVAVDAYVWGGVDAAVASIGIQANLNLITAKLPASATLSLDFDPMNNAQVSLSARTDLELSELSGSVDAYAQVAFWSADFELFSWDGLHQKVPLFAFQKAYPLVAMNYALGRQ